MAAWTADAMETPPTMGDQGGGSGVRGVLGPSDAFAVAAGERERHYWYTIFSLAKYRPH